MNKKASRTRNKTNPTTKAATLSVDYGRLVSEISALLEQSRRAAARSVNAILTTTYWEIGRRIVEHEQRGRKTSEYGRKLLEHLSADLTAKYGRGFSRSNVAQMRAFFLHWEIVQTPSGRFEARTICPEIHSCAGSGLPKAQPRKSEIVQTVSGQLVPRENRSMQSRESGLVNAGAFPLSWSHYVRLLSVEKPHSRLFYESEAIRGGWSVRQLDRQISTRLYERTARSKRPNAMLARGQEIQPEDVVTLEDQVRDPYLLEFLNLKDEYSESELEEALIRHLEWFLLELGNGFAFVARQKRIRIGDEWYRIDLLLFHRRLKCLVVIDLKIGKFTHADAGQMNLYLNYAREHMMEPEESEPVGLILCSVKNDAVVHYAMGGIKAKVFTSNYMTTLPDPEALRQEILVAQRAIRMRRKMEMING